MNVAQHAELSEAFEDVPPAIGYRSLAGSPPVSKSFPHGFVGVLPQSPGCLCQLCRAGLPIAAATLVAQGRGVLLLKMVALDHQAFVQMERPQVEVALVATIFAAWKHPLALAEAALPLFF